MRWYAGADHAGFHLKDALVTALRGLGDEVVDLGTRSPESVDYPDFAEEVGMAVAGEPGTFGLLVCGTGIGVSIAANKVKGIRAAVVSDTFSAQMARIHNDANVLCLGERVVGLGVAESLVRAFREAAFAGGRHQKRVDKIKALEGGSSSR
jgi:ribose 5-phosphate isomerase B